MVMRKAAGAQPLTVLSTLSDVTKAHFTTLQLSVKCSTGINPQQASKKLTGTCQVRMKL